MKKRKAPTNKASRGTNTNLNSTSRQAQRQRLLDALRAAGDNGINTIQARHDLNILMPAARIHELRHNHGLNIKTIRVSDITPEGYPHQCALYVLMPGRYQGDA